MNVESEVDVDRADLLVSELQSVATMAEPALSDEELDTLDEVADFIEEVAGIERGERMIESEMTDKTYRVTRWVDLGDGQIMALSKREVEE